MNSDVKKSFTLSQLTQSIKNCFDKNYSQAYWITGETSEVHVRSGSHCYLELIEKGEDGNICARLRATIWRNAYEQIAAIFFQTTGKLFESGIKVMCQVKVSFSPQYGLSANILNIDPSYTIGEMALQREATIRKLKQMGIFDLNRQIKLPRIIRSIAVISSPTAAGYDDFIKQLHGRDYSLGFSVRLFSAFMQGKDADASVVNALQKILESGIPFDVVVIIRGGGARAELAVFDSEMMAEAVANFPIPILSGIGHERDTSIVDMVANRAFKTPTAVAEFLVFYREEEVAYLGQVILRLQDFIRRRSVMENKRFDSITSKLPLLISSKLNERKKRLRTITSDIIIESRRILKNESVDFDRLKQSLRKGQTQRLQNEERRLLSFQTYSKIAQQKILAHRKTLDGHLSRLKTEVNRDQLSQAGILTNTISQLKIGAIRQKGVENERFKKLDLAIRLSNPIHLLEKGFVIVERQNGKVICKGQDLSNGDYIRLRFHDTTLYAEIRHKE